MRCAFFWNYIRVDTKTKNNGNYFNQQQQQLNPTTCALKEKYKVSISRYFPFFVV